MMKAVLTIVLTCFALPAAAHEAHEDMTPEEKRVMEFLSTWKRPAGNFSNIKHRQEWCCYINGPKQDCFRVKQVRRVDGVLEAFPDTSDPTYQKWYKLNTGVDEDLQKDPRESPDGRSYICIQGELPVCFVAGSGQ